MANFRIILILTCIFLTSVRIFAQSSNLDAIITDPSVTSRCRGMLEKRQQLQEIKQKLVALKKRTESLITKTPPEKKTLKDKESLSLKRINHEMVLNQNKLQGIEETIIKNGCPGISR